MKKIFIDAGHGGKDPGAVSSNQKEKDICLKIALLISKKLYEQFSGHTTRLSRSSDLTVSLLERTTKANKWGANLFVSIHVNAGGGTGFESFIYNGNFQNKQKTNNIRKYIHQAIIKETGFTDRGLKEANFHVLRESSMPAVLTESGFIDNQADRNKLITNRFLNKIVEGHVRGIVQALSLTKKTNSQVIYHTIKQGDTLWSLAEKHETTVQKLIELNKDIDPYTLQIGRKIRINS